MRTLVIDGHNVLGHMDKDGSNANINYLKNTVRIRFQGKETRIVLVFDNGSTRALNDEFSHDNRFKVVFADPSIDDNGDDCVVRQARKFRGQLNGITFVTNDRELKARLRIEGAEHFQSAEEFAAELLGRDENPALATLSEAEEKEEAVKGIDKDALNAELLEAFTKRK